MSTSIPSGVGTVMPQVGQQNIGHNHISNSQGNEAGDTRPANGENPSINNKQLHLTMHHINQKLASSNLKVEFASEQPPGDIWLNVIDASTGKVIQELPPDATRRLAATQSLTGIQIDNQL